MCNIILGNFIPKSYIHRIFIRIKFIFIPTKSNFNINHQSIIRRNIYVLNMTHDSMQDIPIIYLIERRNSIPT